MGELDKGVGVLIVRAGSQAGDRFILDTDITRLGRHPDSEISLDDITVSRRHAEVQHTEQGYAVADSGSLNGTYVNQERVERAMRCRMATNCRSASSDWCSSSGPMADAHDTGISLDRRGARPAARGLPRRHDLEDPLPGEPRADLAGTHVVRLPQVLRPRCRAPAGDPDRAAQQLPAAARHQGSARDRRDRSDRGASAARTATATHAEAHESSIRTNAADTDESHRCADRQRRRSSCRPSRGDSRRRRADTGLRCCEHVSTCERWRVRRRGRAPVTPTTQLMPGVLLDRLELCTLVGMTESELDATGVVRHRRAPGRVDTTAVRRGCHRGRQAGVRVPPGGVDARHLRNWRTSAEREASLYEQLVTPRFRQRNPESHAEALAQLRRLDALGGDLRAAMTRQALRRHFES